MLQSLRGLGAGLVGAPPNITVNVARGKNLSLSIRDANTIISAQAGNTVITGDDGGIYVPASTTHISTQAGNTITIGDDGGIYSPVPTTHISTQDANIATLGDDGGVYVRAPSAITFQNAIAGYVPAVLDNYEQYGAGGSQPRVATGIWAVDQPTAIRLVRNGVVVTCCIDATSAQASASPGFIHIAGAIPLRFQPTPSAFESTTSLACLISDASVLALGRLQISGADIAVRTATGNFSPGGAGNASGFPSIRLSWTVNF